MFKKQAKKDETAPGLFYTFDKERERSFRGVLFTTNIFVPKHDRFAPVKLSSSAYPRPRPKKHKFREVPCTTNMFAPKHTRFAPV